MRGKVAGTAERPRLAVFRSNRGIEAQLVDDEAGRTVAAASWIGLPKSFLSAEEILPQTRQRATNHSYYFRVGLSYRFGSIFNNVVNPRMNHID